MSVSSILNALTASLALRTSAKIPVKHHTTHVENKLSAKQYIIVLYANVLQNGLAIHMFNASNVSCVMVSNNTKFYLKT